MAQCEIPECPPVGQEDVVQVQTDRGESVMACAECREVMDELGDA